MNRIEVELVGDAVNAVVIKLPGRAFPGVVIQGDSLRNLNAIVERLVASLAGEQIGAALEEASEVHEWLPARLRVRDGARRSRTAVLVEVVDARARTSAATGVRVSAAEGQA